MSKELKNGIYYVGVADPTLRVFDIICETEFGTTYNAYLVKGEKTALIESVHDKLCDEYINNIEEIMSISNIDYIICNHTEPDHTGSIVRLLEMNPDIKVVGTTAALKNLKEITNTTFNEVLAKDGQTLDLGDGKIIKFIVAPNLHWPDTMMSYLESEKTLFSCDVLGAHYCEMGITDENLMHYDYYERAMKNYYDSIVAPFNKFVRKGLEKLSGLEIEMVCNSHGPVLKKYIAQAVEKYEMWSREKSNDKKIAAIFYVSAYGYTKIMADTIQKALETKGIEVKSYNIIENDQEEMIKSLHDADCVIFGSPTINRNAVKPVWDIISSMDIVNMTNKPAMVFGSYGWSGEACTLLANHLSALKLKVYESPFKCVFKPSESDIDKLMQYASDFADTIL